MFARASSSAHICVRCQRQLVQRTRTSIKPQGQPWHPRRWQSAGIAHVVDEEEDSVSLEHASEEIPTRPSEKSNRSRNRDKRYRNKHWRPSPTADLGVDTLGKPAEVLILPTKQRKQSQHLLKEEAVTVHEKILNEPQVGVQQSIAAELKPVSWDEAHKNINAVKQEIGQDGGYLRPEIFAKFRDTLCTGFTRNQLLSYLRHYGHHNDANGKAVAALQAKREIANYMMTKIWGLESSQVSDEVLTTTNFFASQEDIDLLLLDRMEELKRMSRLRDVKIDVYRSENCIRLTGLAVDNQATVKEIKSLKTKIVRGNFEISPLIYGFLFPEERVDQSSLQHEPNFDKSLLSTLAQKHKTILFPEPAPKSKKSKPNPSSKNSKPENLQRRTDVVRYVTFDLGKLAYLQRDLFMLSRATQSDEFTYPSIIDIHSTQTYTSALTPGTNSETELGMFRVVACDPKPNDLTYEDMHQDQRTILGKQVEKLKQILDKSIVALSRRAQKQEKSEVERQQVEYDVEFGQTSFPAHRVAIVNEKSFCQQPSTMKFDLNIPQLPQWLAQQTPWKAQDTNARDISARSMGTLIRLCFHASGSQNEPAVEIFLTYQWQDGNSPQITIRKVSLLFGQTSKYVLLPSQTTDIRLSRQDKVVIFEHGKPPDSYRLHFLSQLAHYLDECVVERATPQRLDFKPLLNINLDSKTNKSQLRHPHFFLESAYRVEHSAYQVPGGSSLALEFLSFEPLPSSLSQEAKQVLKLTEEPLMKMSESEGDQVELEHDRSIQQDAAVSSERGSNHTDLSSLEEPEESVSVQAQTDSPNLSQPTADQKITQRSIDLLIRAYDTAVSLSNFGRSSKTDTNRQAIQEARPIQGLSQE